MDAGVPETWRWPRPTDGRCRSFAHAQWGAYPHSISALYASRFEFCADYCVWCIIMLFETQNHRFGRITRDALARYLRDCVCLICDRFATGWTQPSPSVARIIERTLTSDASAYSECAQLRQLVCSNAFGRQEDCDGGFSARNQHGNPVFDTDVVTLAIEILHDAGRPIPSALLDHFWSTIAPVMRMTPRPCDMTSTLATDLEVRDRRLAREKTIWLAHWHALGQRLYVPQHDGMPLYAMAIACCWRFGGGPLSAMPPELFNVIILECLAVLVYQRARGVASHVQRAIRYLNPTIKL
jgi:hypothetical protein